MNIKSIFKRFDYFLARLLILFGYNKGYLISFLFHGIFTDENEAFKGDCDPQQAITLLRFESIIKFYKKRGYQFVSPHDDFCNLDRKGKYVLLSFDDGYYNNTRVVPILMKYQVPAVFFISSGHSINQKSYWWDAVYRTEFKLGKRGKDILDIQNGLKGNKTIDIESQLEANYGKGILCPIGDTDRPMTTGELKEFESNSMVYIGNHTNNHEIITNLNDDELQDELIKCKDYVNSVASKGAYMFAYPNGAYNRTQLDLIKNTGYKLAITTERGRNKLPFKDEDKMQIKRFIPKSTYGNKYYYSCMYDLYLFRKWYDIVKKLLIS
ncbi:polysaccharide deacetylase family protein [Labilibacter marinus]|uniref:polysaccharide deacetylase family protein n=1 Tax=Labilibacter marinus TaxID=1477105 RepID=UPI0008334280|nr:polysaccharide deacetylase family protein [Labilibacter marinus]